MNSPLIGNTSTQSRVKRPLPDGWDRVEVISRRGISEKWVVRADGKHRIHRIHCTWVLDQGGPVLGYTGKNNPLTTEIISQVALAENAGLYGPGAVGSRLEREAAEILIDIVGPYIRSGGEDIVVRWLANGSDACDAAIRLARAVTGRDHFVSTGYHGSSIVFSHEPQNHGIPRTVGAARTDVPWGDAQALAVALGSGKPKAAYIVEVPSNDEDARSFLTHARRLCDKAGALLILDEVVTGFRLALGGAAQLYGVTPDIACYGKAMSNGRAISAVVTRRSIGEYLLDRVFYSNTYNGDPYNCAHVIGTLMTLQMMNDELYSHLWDLGDLLRDGLNEAGVKCIGHGPRAAVVAPTDLADFLSKGLVPRGIVLHRPNYITMAHVTRHVKTTLRHVREIVDKYQELR